MQQPCIGIDAESDASACRDLFLADGDDQSGVS